jgi:hypothetical protein
MGDLVEMVTWWEDAEQGLKHFATSTPDMSPMARSGKGRIKSTILPYFQKPFPGITVWGFSAPNDLQNTIPGDSENLQPRELSIDVRDLLISNSTLSSNNG